MEPLPDFEGCQVVAHLRSGPIADQYEAIQQPLGRRVLVKALSPSILPSSPFAATLEREARLLADLNHPNILHIYDFVRRSDRMWLVLEYVDGFTLDELLGRLKCIPPPAAAAIGHEVARALEHAHARGVIHRDVQPRNVLVSRRGRVKLVNFAVAVDERLPTAPELLDGNTSFSGPAYMSPEQILGEPADPRSDLFSLGVVLYELLSGRRPFDGPDERTTTQRIRHDAAAPLARSVPGVRASLERAVQHCLAKMPSDRFRSAAELAGALGSVLDEYEATSPPQAVADALAQGGVIDEAVPSRAEPAEPALLDESSSLAPIVRILLVCLALLAGGAAVLQYFARRADDVRGGARGGDRLELKPPRPGYLRVVAEPWAHVVVDGQHIDTTPFAEPIPLRAGRHYVRLEHPDAPTERREIRLGEGETVLLDVKLNVPPKPRPSAAVPEPAPSVMDAGPDAPGPSP